jgi:hypothetical protein
MVETEGTVAFLLLVIAAVEVAVVLVMEVGLY